MLKEVLCCAPEFWPILPEPEFVKLRQHLFVLQTTVGEKN
jgi:hypothetical protein